MFATPDEAEHAFYEALEMGDLARMMKVWSDEDEIFCIHPNGLRAIGHEAVQESWQQALSRDGKGQSPGGGHRIKLLRPITTQAMMTAMHLVIEQLSVSDRHGLRLMNYYATNIYHKGPTGWRMVLHHASPAPAEAGVLDLYDLPDTLH